MKNINKKEGHPEVSLLRISRLLGRCRFAITNNRNKGGPELQLFRTTTLFNVKAFTLIELLVVVLIIGILAAIAVPQYQTAVDKTRVGIYLPLLKSIQNAQNVYHMENGEYALDLTYLPVDISSVCPIPNALNNMWFGCKGTAWIDNTGTGRDNPKASGTTAIHYCPRLGEETNSSNYLSCNAQEEAAIYLDYNSGKFNCRYSTARGKRICQLIN